MDTKRKACCVTGHRPNKFPWNYKDTECDRHQEYLEAMACYIDLYIRKEGINYFICGGAMGVDTDFAETVIAFRDERQENIRLEIAIPCRNQDTGWAEEDKKRYANILSKADTVTYLSDTYTPTCFMERNRYMVDNSEVVFVFYNREKTTGGAINTMQYAKKKGKKIELFILNDY